MESGESILNIAMLGKLVFGLLLILGLLGFLVLALKFLQRKKMAFSGLKSDLKIVQTTHLSPQQRLAIVHWNQTQYLIALTGEGGFLLDKKPADEVTKKEQSV
tara:strand:- start:4842 stop:5150 length:309 start_codon:yes stop_codon:yes gene_type:complete